MNMNRNLTTTLLSVLLISAALASAVFAGGFDQNKAYAGSYGAHRYPFQVDPEVQKWRYPTKSATLVPPTPAAKEGKTGTQISTVYGNRYFYRAQSDFNRASAGETKSLNIGGSLGTKWPVTVYNRDIGKGREISRVFK